MLTQIGRGVGRFGIRVRAAVAQVIEALTAEDGVELAAEDGLILGFDLVESAPAPTEADVYILSGQSNASGLVPVADAPADLDAAIAGVETWVKPNKSTDNSGWLETLYLGENNSTENPGLYWGPEMQMAYDIAQSVTDGRRVVLIKYSENGRGLDQDSGTEDFHPNSTGDLYNILVDGYIKPALNELIAQGLTPRIRGFCWMQGEQDSKTVASSGEYDVNLTALISALRADVAADLPFVIGRLSDAQIASGNFPYLSTVQQAQDQVAAATANCSIVNTDSLTTLDGVHYDGPSVIQLGSDFATESQALTPVTYGA